MAVGLGACRCASRRRLLSLFERLSSSSLSQWARVVELYWLILAGMLQCTTSQCPLEALPPAARLSRARARAPRTTLRSIQHGEGRAV